MEKDKNKLNSSKQQRQRQKSKRVERIIHKGIFISNQRRKGNGGRIKSDIFSNKIQVNDFNPALHESQIQWIEIRRYRKGDRFNNTQKNKFNKINDKSENNISKNNKPLYKQKQDQINKNGQNQNNSTENDNKECHTHSEPKISTNQKVKIKQNINNTDLQINKKTPSENQIKKQNLQVNQNDIETQSQNNDDIDVRRRDEEDLIELKVEKSLTKFQVVDEKINETNEEKIKSDKIEDKQKNKQKQKQDQEIIVARIINQTKIVYKEKKFVGILTCEKKKNIKSNFIEKNIKPMEKITKDYYLDVTPIHTRLPKMQLDDLQKTNLKVMNNYIEKIYPQKGKQLTNKKLNEILDIIESIYVVASFNGWDGSQPYANIHQIIGKAMTIDGECNCFLYEHSLNDFHYEQNLSDQISNDKKQQIKLSPNELHVKYDKMVFSIDPTTSVDLDDALSIQKIDEQIFQIGIHISDVSEYLKFIDRKQLIKRTTSVYLPHKVYHMLTQDLMKISSLNPNIERLAFSIFLKMNLKGQIIGESRIQKNIINSRFKLSYQTVQDIISAKINYQGFYKKHPDTNFEQFNLLVEKLQQLTLIGLAHREKRIKFEVFQNREITFELNSQKWPIQISVESRYTSKKIVEEYMIIGNVEAAKHLIKNFKQNALIIYHPKPSQLSIKNFNETFKFLQMQFDFENVHKIQEKFLEIENNKQINDAVKQYIYFKGRRMQQAAGYKLYHQATKQIMLKNGLNSQNEQQVVIKNVHFALGEEFYTHFTSPMRRMADIIVHQSLNCIVYKKQPKPILQAQIDKINQGRKHTKRLKKDLTQIYMCLMIHKSKKCIKQMGIVTSFGLKSISIYIPYFDMMKELIWKDQIEVDKVTKNKQNQNQLDVCIFYDRKSSAGDIYWKVKKYDTVELIIDCTRRPPLRLSIMLEVISTKGKKEKIFAYNPQI